MIGYPERNRRLGAQRFMDAAPIVLRRIKGHGRCMALDLFEKPLVNRVNRRDSMRRVRLLRSTKLIDISTGTPWAASRLTALTAAGE
jgi:hypothetical protein